MATIKAHTMVMDIIGDHLPSSISKGDLLLPNIMSPHLPDIMMDMVMVIDNPHHTSKTGLHLVTRQQIDLLLIRAIMMIDNILHLNRLLVNNLLHANNHRHNFIRTRMLVHHNTSSLHLSNRNLVLMWMHMVKMEGPDK